MGEIVDLPGRPKLPDKNDHEFVVDLCRYAEGLLTEAAILKKYRVFDDTIWTRLGDDDELVRTIEDEKTRRVRDGSTKREKAQQLVISAPGVLSGILNDAGQSARHRIDSAKALNDFASNGPETAPAADRFVITIRLDSDHVETYNKSIAIDPNDGNGDACDSGSSKPDDISHKPRGKLLAGFTDKPWDGDDG